MGTFMGKLDVERRLKGWQESLALALIAIIPVALVPLLGFCGLRWGECLCSIGS